MESKDKMDLSYILNELGEERANYFGGVTPPLMQSVNFCFQDVERLRNAIANEMDTPFYTRGHNPTVAILRKKLAALENAEECLVFSSGSGAIAAGIMSCVQSGDHVVSVQNPYSWTYKLLSNLLSRYGVSVTYVEGTVAANYAAAIRPETKLFLLESPNSMTFQLQDIAAVCSIARQHNITTMIDNSYSTPLNQQPIAMGVDIIVHSGTKYLNGHSDVVMGVLCSTRSRCEQIFKSEYMTLGGAVSPHDAWLMLRGLRTLPLRMERVGTTARTLVDFLASHPRIEKIFYPFYPSSPQYRLALQQMKAAAGQFSVLLKADTIEEVERFCNHLKRFLIATSWGGYESLIYPVCASYGSVNPTQTTLPWNFIRFYIGLEDPEVLMNDLSDAFVAMEKG